MKNRYILLFTLIFGLAGQAVQAMSHVPSNPNLLINKYQTYLKAACEKAGQVLNKHVAKYHPGFNFKWFLSTKWEANKQGFVGVPLSFILNNNDGLATVDHEITHIIKNHIHKREKYKQQLCLFSIPGKNILSRSNNEKYYEFHRETEREADEGVINHPDLLLHQQKRYEKLAPSKDSPTLIAARELCPVKIKHQKDTDLTHPSFEERAARFKERHERLILGYSIIDRNEREKQSIPPIIFSQRPRHIMNKKFGPGHHEDYYADVATDMLSLFKPSTLAQYSFSRNKDLLTSRVIRAIE